jgi:5-methylcytosine-specific restriction endonuclease McrA
MFNQKEYHKQYYQTHKKELSAYIKEYTKNNSEKLKIYKKNWSKQYFQDHKEMIKQHRNENRELINIYNHRYREKPKSKEIRNKYDRDKRKTDLKFNLNCRMVTAIKFSLKENKNGRHWESLVGYTLEELMKHLKRTISNSYCWQDFLEGKLHIDHIIPISAFNFNNSNHIDFKKCWSLDNLQLLPAKDNLIKGNKLFRPFQPALQL